MTNKDPNVINSGITLEQLESDLPAPPSPPDELDAAAAAEADDQAARLEAAEPETSAGDDEPSPEQLQEIIASLNTEELLLPAFQELHGMIAPAWPIEKSIPNMAHLWGKVLDKYVGPEIAKHGELVAAVTVTAICIAPHVRKPRHKPEPEHDPAP